jgi:hypothetical protein
MSGRKTRIHAFENSFRAELRDPAGEKKRREMNEAFNSFYVPNQHAHRAVYDALHRNVVEASRLPNRGASIAQNDFERGLKRHAKYIAKDLTPAHGLPGRSFQLASIQGSIVPLDSSIGKKRKPHTKATSHVVVTAPKGESSTPAAPKASMWKSVETAVGSGNTGSTSATLQIGGSAPISLPATAAQPKLMLSATAHGGGGGANPKVAARNQRVKEVMKEQGLSMIEASKWVKLHG